MSGRTLTASKSEQPSSRFLPNQFQEETEAMLFGALADLLLLGRKCSELVPAIATLDSWLTRAYFWTTRHEDHPERKERQQRVANGESRLCALRGELNGIEQEAKTLRTTFAKHLDRLKPRRRAELLALDGWPQAPTSEAMAAKLWTVAQERGPWPEGEAPF